MSGLIAIVVFAVVTLGVFALAYIFDQRSARAR